MMAALKTHRLETGQPDRAQTDPAMRGAEEKALVLRSQGAQMAAMERKPENTFGGDGGPNGFGYSAQSGVGKSATTARTSGSVCAVPARTPEAIGMLP